MKRLRWMELQAHYFNVTGQMVPIPYLQHKFEAMEAAAKAAKVGEPKDGS